MKVKLVYRMGGHIYVGDETAKRLLKTNMYSLPKHASDEERQAVAQDDEWQAQPTETSEKAVDESNDTSEGGDTVEDAPKLPDTSQVQEDTNERPDTETVRAWAKENGIQVSNKGRVANQVYEQYADAHKE